MNIVKYLKAFSIILALLFCGVTGNALSEDKEKEKTSDSGIIGKETKGKSQEGAPSQKKENENPTNKVGVGITENLVDRSEILSLKKMKGVGKEQINKEERKRLTEEQQKQIEHSKAKFKTLVEEELKSLGEQEEQERKEVKGREYEPPEEKGERVKKKVGEGGENENEVDAASEEDEGDEEEERDEEEMHKLKESEEDLEEALGEDIQEEVLEKGISEETIEAKPSEPEEPEGVKQKIILDFEDADIREVIYSLGDILDINYIIDPKVRGKVNIHTSGEISTEDIFPILETIFEINNLAAVKVGNMYKIIRSSEVRKQPLIPQVGKKVEEVPSPDRMVFQLVPLRYIEARYVEGLLKKFKSKGGYIQDYKNRNILFIVDTSANVKKMLSIIDLLDVSVFNLMKVKFFEIEYAKVKELAKDIENIFKTLGMRKTRKRRSIGVSFIPIERMNLIIVVSPLPDVFEKVETWLAKLDQPSEELDEKIFVYFVENGKADEIGDIIEDVYEKKRRVRRSRRRRRVKKSQIPSVLTGEIKVVVDEINNALIIRANPQDYAKVLKTIKVLDTFPKQVLIEVLIAEVTLDEDTEFGLEWSLASDYASLGGYKGTERVGQNLGLGGLGLDLAQPIAQPGFTYAFVSERLEAFLRAYARENEVDILSSPHILAADNTEAKIEVGKEVPIVTSEYTPTTLEAGETYSRSIEYRDTGILLTVSPRINEKGLVAMELSQEVSDVSEQRIEGINSPIILKRQAETSLVVQDGETIVIAGLIREKKENTMEGIPLLSKIPYLGKAFRYDKDTMEKTELMILITPHVVSSQEEADTITKDFKEKVDSLKKVVKHQ